MSRDASLQAPSTSVAEVVSAAASSSSTLLDLSSRSLTKLPPDLPQLTSVRSIDLSSNELRVIAVDATKIFNSTPQSREADKQLAVLKKNPLWPPELQALRLTSNFLEELGEEVLTDMTSLQLLDLSANTLKSLPVSLLQCTTLTELSLRRNQLHALPSRLGDDLPLLQVLDVSYNHLHSLPQSLGNLKHLQRLSARFNELESVPTALGRATSLRYLDLGENFVNLTSVPGSLGDLLQLKTLDLSNNQISTLPLQLGRLSGLDLLFLEGNPLTFPPPDVLELEDPRDEPHQSLSAEEVCRRKTRIVKGFLAAKCEEWSQGISKANGWDSMWLDPWSLLEWLGSFLGSQGPAGLLDGAAVSATARAALPPPLEERKAQLPASVAAQSHGLAHVSLGLGSSAHITPEAEALVMPSVPPQAPSLHNQQPLLGRDREDREACLA